MIAETVVSPIVSSDDNIDSIVFFDVQSVT